MEEAAHPQASAPDLPLATGELHRVDGVAVAAPGGVGHGHVAEHAIVVFVAGDRQQPARLSRVLPVGVLAHGCLGRRLQCHVLDRHARTVQ